ncbi:MAG: type 4a pilus biogenesis protein PilO [Candidatus Aquilonibacter sp.]
MTVSGGVRVVWMLCAAVFLAVGVGLVWWPTSQTIAALKSQAKTLYDEANQNEAEVRHAAELHSLAVRVSDDVRQLSGQGSQSAVMAATLGLLDRQARAFAIDVRSIVPAPASSSAAATQGQSTSSNAFAGTALEFDVRGRFREVLAFVADLPRHNVLINVSDLNLAGEGDRSVKPILSAKIHATVFRYRGIAEEEAQHASGTL